AGVGNGIFFVLHQIIIHDLVQGSGRFNVGIGFVLMCHLAAQGFSRVISLSIADLSSDLAFWIFAMLGTVPLLLTYRYLPESAPAQVFAAHKEFPVSTLEVEDDGYHVQITPRDIPHRKR